MKLLNLLRLLAFFEGLSLLLLLFVAMPLKYYFGKPETVKIVGMAHGVLFVLYSIILLIVYLQYKWKFSITLLAFLASFVPLGTFYADKKWFRNPDNN